MHLFLLHFLDCPSPKWCLIFSPQKQHTILRACSSLLMSITYYAIKLNACATAVYTMFLVVSDVLTQSFTLFILIRSMMTVSWRCSLSCLRARLTDAFEKILTSDRPSTQRLLTAIYDPVGHAAYGCANNILQMTIFVMRRPFCKGLYVQLTFDKRYFFNL